jgi:hypothetical protein
MPQNPAIVATKSPSADVFIFNTGEWCARVSLRLRVGCLQSGRFFFFFE